MRDQLDILISVDQVSDLSATVGTRLSKHFDKGLAMMLKATNLEGVRRMPAHDRNRLARKIQLALTRNDLKAVSKLWEKDRTIGNDETHTELSENLVTLMMRAREPYQKLPASFSLKKARELLPPERRALAKKLQDWAPNAHLKSLLKKWDKHNPSIATAPRNQQVRHLLALIDDEEEPAPSSRRAR